MRTLFTVIALLASLSFYAESNAEGPSFNCNQELSSIEESICSDPTLSEVDRKLSKSYKFLKENSEDQNELKNIQSAWVMYRDKVCTKTEFGTRERHHCLKAMYQSRFYEMAIDIQRIDKTKSELEEISVPKLPIPETTLQHKDVLPTQSKKAQLEELNVAMYQEGFMFDYGNSKQTVKGTTRALECAKKLNTSSSVKTKTCHNFTKDLGKTEIMFLKSDPICASVSVDDQDVKILMFEGDERSGLSYKDGTLKIENMMNTGNGLTYNFNRDSGAFLYQNQLRLQMSDCI